MKKVLLICLAFLATFAKAQTILPELGLASFSGNFLYPLDIENCGDSRLFIVEKQGKIWMVDSTGNKSAQPFLDISARVDSKNGEQGLLGLAFHPEYETNGYFFVNYIDSNANTQISRFSVSRNNPDSADPLSEVKLLSTDQPYNNHNGGCLKFGLDGYLYIGTGDGGSEGDPLDLPQNKKSLLGKMLRIDVNSGNPYAIPPTNPFVNDTSYAPEIWALGMRNPWRYSFDRLTGDLWIGDVGQDDWEEVDFALANDSGGENYGWSCYEGDYTYVPGRCDSSESLTFPIAEYSHNDSGAAVTGGYVYRGSQFPNMYGKYFCTDYITGLFRTIYSVNGSWTMTDLLRGAVNSYVSFGENNRAELFVADIANGTIYHLFDSIATGIETAGGFLKNNFSLFPNPSTGQINIKLKAAQNEVCRITISNAAGENIFYAEKNAVRGINQWQFSTTQFPSGVYLIQLQAADGFVNKEFVVE